MSSVYSGHPQQIFWTQLKKEGKEQRYTYRVLQTIQMKLILLCVLAEHSVLGSAKTALKLQCEI